MRKSYFIKTLIIGIMLIQSAHPAFAQNLGGKTLIHDVNRLQNQASHAAQVQQNELQNIIQRADNLITNRISSLNTILTRIQSDKRLSDSEKSSLAADI